MISKLVKLKLCLSKKAIITKIIKFLHRWSIPIFTGALVLTSYFQYRMMERQSKTMIAQLQQMSSSGVQTDKLISSAEEQAHAALTTADAAKKAANTAESTFNQNKEFAGKTLEEMKKQAHAALTTADGVTAQVDQMKTDAYLNYRPVVFIKADEIQTLTDKNPYNHSFILTNSGKLPARNVTINVNYAYGSEFLKGGSVSATDSIPKKISVLKGVAVFPGANLNFRIPVSPTMSFDNPGQIMELTFIIKYYGDSMGKEMSETMKFVYTTKKGWFNVGQDFEVFKEIPEISH